MKRLLKIIFGLFGALLLLLVVAVAGVLLFVDPNDYRDTITEQVQEQTGRELLIKGEIKLSLFPWLGLELGALELGNAEGFDEGPFARIEAVEARVKLLPLLKMKTEVDTVLLRGLELNLQRRQDGVSNWDDLDGGKPEAKPEARKQATAPRPASAPRKEKALAALAIAGIALEQARVEWRDDLSGQHFTLQNLNFRSGEIRIGRAFPLSLSTDLASSAPQLKGSLSFSGDVTADPQAQRYQLAAIKLDTDLSGEGLPGGNLAISLAGKAAADLKAQTLALKPLTLNAAGLELKVTANGEQIIDRPSFSGKLETGEFGPRQLLSELGIAVPEMADPSVLGRATLSSNFSAGLEGVALDRLSLRLDDTTLGGSASVSRFDAPVVRYALNVNEIDVDRYMAPPITATATAPVPATPAMAATAAASTTTAAPDQPPQLPLELLRSLDIDGTVKLGKLKAINLHSSDIVATLKAKQGQFRLHPLSATLYQGSYSGDLGFDVRGEQLLISLDEKLSGVEAGPLLKDFMGEEHVSGTAQLAARLTMRGLEPDAIRSSLNGEGSFSFSDGMVKGFNIGQLIREGYAAYLKQPRPEEEQRGSDFANLSGSFKVKNGVVTTKDLSARSTLFQVAGKGTVNLVKEELDLRLDTVIVSDIRDATGERMGDLKGEKLPVTIKGSFREPKIGVDVGSVLEAKAKAALDKEKARVEAEIERKKREAEAEAKRKLEAEKKKLQRDLEKKLQQMLKF